MRIASRTPRWNDPFFLTGLIFTPLLLLWMLLIRRIPPESLPVCGFKRLAGLPCPTCGAWRASMALLEGRWLSALRLQPLLAGALIALLLLSLYAVLVACCGIKYRYIQLTRRDRRLGVFLGTLMLAANWLYLIVVGS